MDTIAPSEPSATTALNSDGERARAADVAGHGETAARTRRSTARDAAVIVAMVGATITVVGGSPGWTAVRLAVVALVGSGLHRLGRRWPVLSILVGCVVVAIGIGLVPHLVDGRPTPRALTAVALIGSGLTLAIVGTTDAVRHRRWWWRLLGGATALVVLGATASIVAPAVLVTNVPRPQLGEHPASRGLAAEAVTFTTSDGVEIAAWYVPSHNGAAVVLRHGAGSTRSDVLDQATVLAHHGYGVLLTDARGHGESTGRAMDFGWYGDDDVAAAIDHLEVGVGIERIGLVGMSMGGEEVLGAAGTQPRVRAVVAEGATARRAEDKAWLGDVYGVRGAFQEQIERLQDGLTNLLTDAERPTVLRDAVRRSEAAILLITAGDVRDELHAAAHIATGAPERVQVWTVDGAGHTDGLATDPEGWERRVIAFLDAHL